ncbi:tRNA 2-thiouridine(34) synthase MnmA [Dehalogenimonas alkenigignens]|uniref:tRNA-specific 2-thiouridylase MnmA n=1 Tax=Dehalogenimonas alkenigignens TaxID=1217799 RepID=A0A0W0GJH9_9CHLR|nr:tRNA 2-thiouridine(34) synthase MnmA [Dehalogenimonas alkenigignens]KTB48705.1 tRNA (5-methylaminomethyl-2-thiouridylate)-methyltransferase [Dehalogenimonas alkenigignens]
MIKPQAIAAMSGGVDSSVSAMLLKRAGFSVLGLTMRLFGQTQEKAAERAAAVAEYLGIEHRVIDFTEEFQSSVIEYFCAEYAGGRTPNPCVVCNRQIKFGALLEAADSLGIRYLATGHYARIEPSASGYRLLEAADGAKDQSYFLYSLSQRQLGRALFPLGSLLKSQVRELAESAGLPSFPSESQDICFLGGQDYGSFLSSRVDAAPGEIVEPGGKVIGRHRGLIHYTVGQRHGLGISSPVPKFVLGVEPAANRVIVGEEKDLYRQRARIQDVSWINGSPPLDASRLSVRIRYRMRKVPLESFEVFPDRTAALGFSEPVRGVTPGQSAVIYREGEVLGGGIICG